MMFIKTISNSLQCYEYNYSFIKTVNKHVGYSIVSPDFFYIFTSPVWVGFNPFADVCDMLYANNKRKCTGFMCKVTDIVSYRCYKAGYHRYGYYSVIKDILYGIHPCNEWYN